MKFYLKLSFCSCLLVTSAFSQDGNANGLDDIWEYLYNTGGITSSEDSDSDGFSNYEESIAGTDPLSSEDHPFLSILEVATNNGSLSFDTKMGKDYELFHSKDLMSFSSTGYGFIGDGHTKVINLELPQIPSPIIASFWADNTALNTISSSNLILWDPDGVTELPSLEAPKFKGSGYTGRITALITPAESGAFNFYLTSTSQSELYFSEDGMESGLTKIAEVGLANSGLSKTDWLTYSSQSSEAINLASGGEYLVDLRYLSQQSGTHAAIAWSGPGLIGIEQITNEDLADVSLSAEAFEARVLFEHDYDTADQTGTLWSGSIQSPTTINGMSGNAELANAANTVNNHPLGEPISDHLYATWQFNVGANHVNASMQFFQTGTADEAVLIAYRLRNGAPQLAFFGSQNVVKNLEYEKTYRVELVTTQSPDGLTYRTPSVTHRVAEDTMDIYITDANGDLVTFVQGLGYRDNPSSIKAMRLNGNATPELYVDSWEITNGMIAGNGYLKSGYNFSGDDSLGDNGTHFYRLEVGSQDQDGDGVSDNAELAFGEHVELLFFDEETVDGVSDADALESLLTTYPNTSSPPVVSLVGTDAAAYEDNSPYTSEDNGSFLVTRTGTLQPLTVGLCIAPLDETGNATLVCDGTCCLIKGSAGAEVAENVDYVMMDQEGNVITDCLEFDLGEMSKVITVKAIKDDFYEFPETLNIQVATCEENSYTIGVNNTSYVQLFDKPDHVDNKELFKGEFSQEPGSTPTNGSGYVIMSVNGPRTEALITNQFAGLTSAQQDSHVHKSNVGPTPGDIVYEITETPGDPSSDPLNGNLTNYEWDLIESSGAVPTSGGTASRQVLIDSIFGQNEETPLYLNIHTVNNAAGEIWAFFSPVEGFTEDPGDAAPAALAGSSEYPILEDELLEVEVRRFLNQATFGATEEEVLALLSKIEDERDSNPDYHRSEAFEDWIDVQMDPAQTQQTFILDMTLAHTFQHLELSGAFDPARNIADDRTETPTLPTEWPHVIRPNGSPEYWYLSDVFPLNERQFDLAKSDNDLVSKRLPYEENLAVDWQLKINGGDQLRQKTGFALQQIVVVSDSNKAIRENGLASASWRDMINYLAFSNYREVLGYANWSPVMGYWLSSIKNQKAVDFDGDGNPDAFPDENLARENMQLFSIGLFDMWSDGTLALNADGLPSPTYTIDDIKEFSKVITGQYPSTYGQKLDPTWGGVPFSDTISTYNKNFNVSETDRDLFALAYHYPMNMDGSFHSDGVKSFAGVTIDNTDISDPTELAKADIEDAMDWLAGIPGDGQPDYDGVNSHRSVPAFISYRLIQRFTTSNPSTEYLHRVATVFKNSEGHLGQTVKAILLDPEARNINLNDSVFGMKKSPVEAFAQLMIALGGHSYIPLVEPGDEAENDLEVEPVYEGLSDDVDYSNEKIYLSHYGYPASQIAAQKRNIRLLKGDSTTEEDTGLEMEPFYAPSVFNFYLPTYTKSGAISDAGIVAPEMQLVTEQGVIRNINYYEELIYDSNGHGGLIISDRKDDQRALFGNPDEDDLEHLFLPIERLADELYPSSKISGTDDRTSESLEDEVLVDRLDDLLTNGMFRLRYPYDKTDVVDNPREIIIDIITDSYGSSEYEAKLKDALYLLTYSPEYQIRK